MLKLLATVGGAAIGFKAGVVYGEFNKNLAELNNCKSKFKLDREFLAYKLGIENVPDLISSQAEYTKLKEKNISEIKWVEKHENGGGIEPINPWAKAMLVTNALYMTYSEPWTALSCFSAFVATAAMFGEPLIARLAEERIKSFRTNGQFEFERKIESAEKEVKASVSELADVKEQIIKKVNEYLNNPDEKSALLLKETRIQLAKIDLILSSHSLAQHEGYAPA